MQVIAPSMRLEICSFDISTENKKQESPVPDMYEVKNEWQELSFPMMVCHPEQSVHQLKILPLEHQESQILLRFGYWRLSEIHNCFFQIVAS